MVLGAAGSQRVAVHLRELVGQSLGVRADLLRVHLEGGSGHLLQLRGDARHLVDVRSSLETGEHRIGDLGLEVARVFAVEDHSGTRTTQRLVRGGRDDVTVLEGVGGLSGGHEARDVRHVHHQEGAVLVGDGAVSRVVPVARVGRASADNKCGLEQTSLCLEGVIVDDAGDGVHAVGKRLEVDGGRRDGLAGVLGLRVGVKAVSEVTT